MRAYLEAWLVEFEFQPDTKPPQPQPIPDEPDEPTPPIPPEPDPIKPTPPDFPHMVYIVQEGDTMYRIALDNNITLQELIKANPHIKVASLIYPGDIIYIPIKESDEPVEPIEPDDPDEPKRNIFQKLWDLIIGIIKKLFNK